MDMLVDLLVKVCGPAAAIVIALVIAIRWLEKREAKCAETARSLQAEHTAYIEQTTKTVTKALVENTQSNQAVAHAVRSIEQTLSGKRPTT